MDSKDDKYHRRCLELAENGLGRVATNPLVGAVIVAEGRIIGEGYHAVYGGAHAEANAINSVKDISLLKKSTLFVNLEPCVHFGKTPPCADLIIEKKIPRVKIGIRDPFPCVAGKGIEKLKAAGVEVEVGNNEAANWFVNRRFLTFYEKDRPYVILKWAETADGFIDIHREQNENNRPTLINDELTLSLVHKWRSEEQAILVGTNTALLDNPMLNVRSYSGLSPIRMVLDENLKIPRHYSIFDRSIKTVIFNSVKEENDGNILFRKVDFSKITNEIMKYCFNENIQSIIVEGGAKLHSSFINSGIWDEARVFRADICFGNGVKAVEISNIPKKQKKIGNSILYYIYNL
jgi:diaminohydroxyphosphoribosylaminopyrimidine deaminase/5-amino-6-(5-phosphoribosylamino)uracil reductase